MHKILRRQIERYYGDIEHLPEEFKTFVEAVGKTYSDYEKEYALIERSLNISSKELTEINQELRKEKEVVEQKVRKRTAELEDERLKLTSVTAHMADGAILLDPHGQMLFSNRAMQHMLGLKDSENDKTLERLFKKFEKVNLKENAIQCVTAEEPMQLSGVESDTNIYNILFRHVAAEEHRRSIVGVLIFMRDITEETLLERSKSELVAVASHQLRTPLTAMRGNVEMLVDESYGKLNTEQHELLDDIQMSAIRLITMVNDMLDITKIEKGDLEMTPEKLNISEITDSVLSDLADYAKRHEFTVQHKKSGENPQIYGDKMRVRQVLQNLIDNAIKYSRHPGKLDISYTSKKDGYLELALSDNGIGIPKAEQPKMFGRFYRASNTARTTSSGSGLGLYIVKSIIEQMGGAIRFESEEGVGTTFFVTFPTKEVQDTHATKEHITSNI